MKKLFFSTVSNFPNFDSRVPCVKKRVHPQLNPNQPTTTPRGDQLSTRHQQLLEQLKPVSPCRFVQHEFRLGEHLNNEPFQEPMKWIPAEIWNDLIEEGELGDWISSLVLVTHFDKNKRPIVGDYRVCLDATNKCFNKLPISMPLISDITSKLSSFKFKAVIDLKWSFTHLPLTPDQHRYFGFATPVDAFRFKRDPFGFLNSPANQQHFMVRKIDRPFRIRWKGLERFIATFIDDIHLSAMTLMELLQMIYEVLEQLVLLTCSVVPGSVQFGTCVEALGQLVSETGTTIKFFEIVRVERSVFNAIW